MLKAIIFDLDGLTNDFYSTIPYITDLIQDLRTNEIKYTITTAVKPTPEQFLQAADFLKVIPEECLAIVDSNDSAIAADAAGIICIGYEKPGIANHKISKTIMIVEGFDEIDYYFVNRAYQYAYMKPVSILTTDHFIVRELGMEDVDALYRICQSPSIKEYLDDFNDNLAVEKEKHLAYIKNIYHYYGFGLWGIYFRENNRLVGRCGIEYTTLDKEDIYEIGYLLDPQYQGQGYAKEFVMDILNYCFMELNIHRIIAVIDERNQRSIHLAEQVGMKKIGTCTRNQRNCFKYEITYHL